ncbi:hypothetical protein Goklo_000378 [Gossypium klotzschianum]|uniref:TF-B3 domain-containing protein n=1 Tax=Gossypium klotzschianum TaxID=34286 RepID=A0A7J8VWU4_9ROSI|nr:hypothetical protein [Gossypium klotzschianum]
MALLVGSSLALLSWVIRTEGSGEVWEMISCLRSRVKVNDVALSGRLEYEAEIGQDPLYLFKEVWQEFLGHYYIRVGYVLAFRYEGNSTFSNMFGGSKLSNCINWGGDVNRQNPKAVNNQPIRGMAFHLMHLNFKNSANEVKLCTSGSGAMKPEPKKRGRKRKFDPNVQDSSAGREDDADMRLRCYESASARKRTVTAEERERAINAAKAFEPINPFCRVVLRPSYLYRGCIMYLPSCFAEKHLSGVSDSIKLQLPDGRQWSVRCRYKGGKAKFSRGWYEFTLENNLGEGDVCVFELLRSREIVLKVTVFRVMESGGLMHRSQ